MAAAEEMSAGAAMVTVSSEIFEFFFYTKSEVTNAEKKNKTLKALASGARESC